MIQFLSVAVIWLYVGLIVTAMAMTYFSYGSLRFHPVVTLMASGIIAPTVTLLVLRVSGLFGYNTSRTDGPTQVALCVGFCYAVWAWFRAMVMVYQDRQSTRRGRSLDRKAARSQ